MTRTMPTFGDAILWLAGARVLSGTPDPQSLRDLSMFVSDDGRWMRLRVPCASCEYAECFVELDDQMEERELALADMAMAGTA